MQISPAVKVSNTLESIGSSLLITAKDLLGNIVGSFLDLFTVSISFEGFDLSHYNLNTLGIYSSEDGINWIREDTSIDFDNQIASADVNHLSYFTIMAERVDTAPPITNVVLEGEEGDSRWFRSDVRFTLEAEDNDEGLGVAYILYRVNEGEWEQYFSQIVFSEEGNYHLEFYSVDNDENIEDTQVVEFSIDKTRPSVSLSVDPTILWPPDGKMVEVSILGNGSDNTQIKSMVFSVEDEYNEVEPSIGGFNERIKLKADRKGNDMDGREYRIKVVLTDISGNEEAATATVRVQHDKGKN
jgi:hypothetical protein